MPSSAGATIRVVSRRLIRRLRGRPRAGSKPGTEVTAGRTGLGEPSATPAGEAELDELRGELVRELDRLASRQPECSAAVRRVDL